MQPWMYRSIKIATGNGKGNPSEGQTFLRPAAAWLVLVDITKLSNMMNYSCGYIQAHIWDI